MKFGMIMDLRTRFISIIIFEEVFKYGDGAKFVVMFGQTLKHSVLNCAILCDVICF
jgi:hypothetical protein